MYSGEGILFGGIFLGIGSAVIYFVILYFVVKAAVKNGMVAANNVMMGMTAKTSTINVTEDLHEGDIRICKRCGSFKKYDAFCSRCGSMGTGGRVSVDKWDALKKIATEQEKSTKVLLNEMTVCRQCNTIKKVDDNCPDCGAGPYRK